MRPISGVGASAPSEARSAPGRGGAGRLGMMSHLEAAVGVFEDFHLDTSVAGTLHPGQQLQGALPVLDCVVPSHLASVLETEDFVQGPVAGPRAVG